MAAAYAKYQTAAPDLAVRAAQAALLYLGIEPGPTDGFHGPLTRAGLLAFREREALLLTGLLDEQTEATLAAAAFPP